MSRLDSFLRRIAAQRDCLDAAARLIAEIDGPVLELGLGNGRTFDHLRELLPDREIFVFDRRVAAHPDCIPDDRHLVLGDLRETLPGAMARIGTAAALAHADLGVADAEVDARLAAFVGGALVPLMRPGGVVVSGQAMTVDRWTPLAPPPAVKPGRYHMWRVGGCGGGG